NRSPGPTTCPGRQLRRTSTALSVRFYVEAVVLDHVVREQLLAHLLDALSRLALAGGVEVHLDVLADAHVGHLGEAERREALPHGDALRVVDDGFGSHDHASDHVRPPRVPALAQARTPRPRAGAGTRAELISRSAPWAGTAACAPASGRR